MTFALDEKGALDGPIVQLLYRSRSLIGSGGALELSGILAQARPLNARDDITGVLTAVNGTFVQIIEGGEAVVDDLLTRLRRDPRHTELEVIGRRMVKRRAFGDWDMVSPRLAGLETATLSMLLADPAAGLDQYASVLSKAVDHQTSLLEGWSTTDQADARRAASAQAARPPV